MKYALISVIGIVVIFTGGTHGRQYGYDEQEENTLNHGFDPTVEDSSFRFFRNIDQGNSLNEYQPPQSNVRFGWQNPIRVAPTLPPRQSYSTNAPPFFYPTSKTTTEYYNRDPITSGSNQNAQYNRPSTGRQPPPNGRQRCPSGSRREKASEKCLPLGSSCGVNMAFYEDPTDREFGQCDCAQDAKRPLVFYRETAKCYYVFQQAFCKPSDWLIIENSQPTCSLNRCQRWTNEKSKTNWNWQDNGSSLNNNGTVALFKERICAFLGWPCRQEGREQLTKNNLLMNPSEQINTGISLLFDGEDLVCRRGAGRQETPKRELALVCKRGLLNKWRLDGRCRNFDE